MEPLFGLVIISTKPKKRNTKPKIAENFFEFLYAFLEIFLILVVGFFPKKADMKHMRAKIKKQNRKPILFPKPKVKKMPSRICIKPDIICLVL